MNSKGQFIWAFLLLFAVSCSTGQNKKDKEDTAQQEAFNYGDNLEQAVVGTWKNNAIDVDLKTYNNTDTSFQVNVSESSWKLVMNINPIYTQLRENGTFHTEYRDTLDQVFHTTKGVWYLDGDSLFLEDEKGNLFPYKILVQDNEMEMRTLVDYDEDGEKDDFYFGKYKRVEK